MKNMNKDVKKITSESSEEDGSPITIRSNSKSSQIKSNSKSSQIKSNSKQSCSQSNQTILSASNESESEQSSSRSRSKSSSSSSVESISLSSSESKETVDRQLADLKDLKERPGTFALKKGISLGKIAG